LAGVDRVSMCARVMPRLAVALLVSALLSGCAGPLAFIPITPLLSSALASRGEDSKSAEAITEMQKKGDWPGLAKFAQDRLLKDPSNASFWVMLGYALVQQSRYPDAIQALTRAVSINPEDIDGWNLLADAQRRGGQPGASSRTLQRAAAVDPTSAVTRYLMGEAFKENGESDRAEEAFRDALKISPELALAWFGLGELLLRTGSANDLEVVAENLTHLDPKLAKEFAQLRARGKR
jgi:cytochrome c-type biogenesis protein CcmH/NrfG